MTELILHGPLAPDGETRIRRRLDDYIQLSVRRGRSVNVTGGRQSGKTTSLLELRQWVVSDGGASAYVDLSPLGDIDRPPAEWLADFAAAINRSLLPEEIRGSAPAAPPDFAGIHDYLLQLAVAASPRRPLVIILDEVTGVPVRYQHGFFYSIRAMINLKSDPGRPPGAADLQFVFGGSFDPDRLIRDSNNSPFNVSETIDTASFDFDADEISRILTIAGSDLTPDDVLVLTGGHPYLTNLVAMLPTGTRADDVATLVIGRTDLNLSYVSRNLRDQPDLLALACRIARGEEVPFLPALDDRLSELLVVGLLKPAAEGNSSLRSSIYQRLLEHLCPTAGNPTRAPATPGPLDFIPDALRANLGPLLAAATVTASDSPAVSTVCMGAVVEGALLSLLELHTPDELSEIARSVNSEVVAGRLNGSMRISSPTSPADWSLAQMIEGARLAGLVSGPASQVSHGMRDWRNLIHPAIARDLYPTGVPPDVGQAAVANGAVLLREIAEAAVRRGAAA